MCLQIVMCLGAFIINEATLFMINLDYKQPRLFLRYSLVSREYLNIYYVDLYTGQRRNWELSADNNGDLRYFMTFPSTTTFTIE